tara:strand:+ start:355 stop:624 length:270 start_codon:yes stop_codon:yes gene_type:complete
MENEVKTLLIEKGIPMSGGHTKRDYIRNTILEMEVGDSVAFDNERECLNFITRANHMRKRKEINFKFSRRRIEGGPLVECAIHRVWRVS